MWLPNAPLQVGQIASLPASLALSVIFSLQARQMMWPLGQAGMGPLLGKCRHTGHSTMLLMSPTRLLSLAASSGGFFFDLLFVFAVCLLSVFCSIFGFFFAGLDKIGRRGAGFDTSLMIGRGWVSHRGWVDPGVRSTPLHRGKVDSKVFGFRAPPAGHRAQ